MDEWLCSLLLYVQFAVFVLANSAVIGTLCPTNCSCTTGDEASSRLSVDCWARRDVDQLADQVDSLLSGGNMTNELHLTSLSITISPLTLVPPSICRLTTLTHLYLDYNQLTRLPDNCLSNLSNLTQFSAHDNAIETLQNGVFDGLTKLLYLSLNRNRISSIGLRVFATSSNLSSLFHIQLSENHLTYLEPWVYDRGTIGSFEKMVSINLTHNKISKFTNRMGFYARLCNKKTSFAYLFLQNNTIKHFADIINGWQLNITQLISCYRFDTQGRFNLEIWLAGNNIACNCINYNFYRIIALQNVPGIDNIVRCNLSNPVTGKWSIVNDFHTDLILFVCLLTERCPVGCVCVHRPENATLHIYCSNRNLTHLPLELPKLPDSRMKYKLDFSKNRRLYHLEYYDYFINTSILDVSNSGVDDIEDWEEIAKIPDVNLFGNKISTLPSTFLSTNITTAKLNLANNTWDCSCDNKWMSKWLGSIADRLTQKVLCYSPSRLHGKNIAQIDDEEFCVDPASEAVKRALPISLSSVATVLLVLLSIGVTIYRFRVKLYARWKFHPFDCDECLGEDMDTTCSSHPVPTTICRTETKSEFSWNGMVTESVILPETFSLEYDLRLHTQRRRMQQAHCLSSYGAFSSKVCIELLYQLC